MEEKNPSRDKIIALCIAANMNYTITNRCLKQSGFSPLYVKSERDVRIAVCINQGLSNVINVNIELEKYGLAPLE